ncbi:MAG TPA: fumarylacetoacetate hydrolase family protein [Clostridia bacterium]|nr:fumarylacetoacetate hydrolase family protein [Clostridia bacterium]
MKFVRFKKDNDELLGVFTKDENAVIEVSSVLSGKKFATMIDLIEQVRENDIKKLKMVLAGETSDYLQYHISEVKLCSPIKKPIHDIICVGVNYKDHLEETKESFGENSFKKPAKSVYFSKRAIEIIGSDEVIKSRLDLDEQLDYEVELAVIIGKKGTCIPKDKVEEYIFGYSVFNDISSRKLQQQHLQWYRGKSLDTYTAMGPSIIYKTDLPFPIEVDVISSVNDEVRQYSNTKLLLADIPTLISEISNGITLEPGDIIATGTPSGVGMGFKPPRFMKKGDTVTCEIPEIGKLTNIVE